MQAVCVLYVHAFHLNPTCRPSHPGVPPTEAAILQHRLQPGGTPLQRPTGSRHCGVEHTLQAATARRVHLVAGGAGPAGKGGLCGDAAVSSTECIQPTVGVSSALDSLPAMPNCRVACGCRFGWSAVRCACRPAPTHRCSWWGPAPAWRPSARSCSTGRQRCWVSCPALPCPGGLGRRPHRFRKLGAATFAATPGLCCFMNGCSHLAPDLCHCHTLLLPLQARVPAPHLAPCSLAAATRLATFIFGRSGRQCRRRACWRHPLAAW